MSATSSEGAGSREDRRYRPAQSADQGRLDLSEIHGPKSAPAFRTGRALTKPDCIKALATPETSPNGRLLDYPADWGSRAATIAADNNMQDMAVPAGSEGALVAELESAAAAKKPLLMMFWGPHYALAESTSAGSPCRPARTQENEHCINPPDVAQDCLVRTSTPSGPRPMRSCKAVQDGRHRAAEDDAGRSTRRARISTPSSRTGSTRTRRSGSPGSKAPGPDRHNVRHWLCRARRCSMPERRRRRCWSSLQ